ncbi:MAG: hypothetical protein JKY81_01540 [Colwellia sp.]|nr:hypothetical protein [Colwellia sp.]
MTTEMHSEYHGHEAAVKSARSTLAFANKQLGRFDEGTPEYQEALEFRNSARDRLASLEN